MCLAPSTIRPPAGGLNVRDFGRTFNEKMYRSVYLTSPAFLRVRYAPRFRIVFKPFADTLIVIFLPSSGIKRVFFWRFTWRRRAPVGLYFVARVRGRKSTPPHSRHTSISYAVFLLFKRAHL